MRGCESKSKAELGHSRADRLLHSLTHSEHNTPNHTFLIGRGNIFPKLTEDQYFDSTVSSGTKYSVRRA